MERYHRIVSIDDFDYFQGWEDTEPRSPHSFGQRTVIFGPNGAGKSTLASIFYAVERAQDGDEADARLSGVRFELTNGRRIAAHRDVSNLPRTIVFGREYVERNLRPALDAQDGVGSPLYAVGEEQAGLADEIQRVAEELKDAERAEVETREAAKKAEKDEQDVVDRIREDVVEKLNITDSHRYHMSQYKRQAARELMGTHPDVKPLTPEELAEQLGTLAADPDDLPRPLAFDELPDIPGQLHDELSRFVQREVVSETIDRLAAAPPLAGWAQQGLDLHEAGDDCGFCGSTITEQRLTALRAHFDESYQDLQKTADRLDAELDRLAGAIDIASVQLGRLEGDGGTIGRWISDNLDDLHGTIAAHLQWISTAREIVDQRRRDPLRLEAWEVPARPARQAWQNLSNQVTTENKKRRDRADNIDAAKEQATASVLRHIAATHRSDFDEARQALKQAGPLSKSAESHASELRRTLGELQSRERAGRRDGRKLARQLTDDLSRYLGFRGLTVTYDEVEKVAGFRFLRDGKPVAGLSEGERGAIALLYFLRRLDSDEIVQPDPDGGAPINTLSECCIVIDDPVSSFDNDTLLTAYTYLRDRFTSPDGLTCAQLIVLTHNFHFMRLWMVDFGEKAQGDETNARKRKIDPHTMPDRRVSFLDLRPTLKAGDLPRRVSHLRDIGGSRSGRSEYHLLFEEVCHAYEDGAHARLLLAGNAARRMLESFAYWKWPQGAQFAPTVRDLGRHHGVPDPIIEDVVRTTNHVSHRLEVGINDNHHVGDVSEALRSVLWYMRQCDEEHFTRMCAARGVEPPELGPKLTHAESP